MDSLDLNNKYWCKINFEIGLQLSAPQFSFDNPNFDRIFQTFSTFYSEYRKKYTNPNRCKMAVPILSV